MSAHAHANTCIVTDDGPVDVYLIVARMEGFGPGEDCSEDEWLAAYQTAIDLGLVWSLQGHFGRTARDLILSGLCHSVPERKKTP